MSVLGPGAVCCGNPISCTVRCDEKELLYARDYDLPQGELEPTPEDLEELEAVVAELLAEDEGEEDE